MPVTYLFSNRFGLLLTTQAVITVLLCLGHDSPALPDPGAIAYAWFDLLNNAHLAGAIGYSAGVWLLALLLSSLAALAAAAAGILLNRHNRVPVLMGLLGWLVASGAGMRLYAQPLQPHLSLLVLALAAMSIPGVVALTETVPSQALIPSHVFRFSDWGRALNVLVRHQPGTWLALLRCNATTGWALLSVLEALTPERTGLATRLFQPGSHLPLSHLLAIELTILALGTLQDYLLGQPQRMLLARHLAGRKAR